MALFKRRLRSPKAWNELTEVIIEMQEAIEAWAARLNPVILHKQDKLIAGDGIIISGDVISATGGAVGWKQIARQELSASGKFSLTFPACKDLFVTLDIPTGSTISSNRIIRFYNADEEVCGWLQSGSGTTTAMTRRWCRMDGTGGFWIDTNAYASSLTSTTVYACTTASTAKVMDGAASAETAYAFPAGSVLAVYGRG